VHVGSIQSLTIMWLKTLAYLLAPELQREIEWPRTAQRSRRDQCRSKGRSCRAVGSHSHTRDRSSRRSREPRARLPSCPVVSHVRLALGASPWIDKAHDLETWVLHMGADLDDFSASFVTLQIHQGPPAPVKCKDTHQNKFLIPTRQRFVHLHYRVVAVTDYSI
jgi:hypothetical protein